VYLVGHDTLGWEDGAGSWTYAVPDALGSVRQAVDATAAVVAAREWSPYGVESGGARAGLGYTGEWFDAGVGLQYLRARWYDSCLNHFTSPDTIIPDYREPQSLPRYVYVENNPILYTDPSGLTPETRYQGNPYDLTLWMYEELAAASNSWYVNRLHALWAWSPRNPPVTVLGYSANKGRALLAWTWLVKDQAKWDFKHDIRDFLRVRGDQGGIVLRSPGNPGWYEFSVPGNIFYGFVGRAAGFPGELLHGGASVAEALDPSYKQSGDVCCPPICLISPPGMGIPPLPYCFQIGCFHLELDELQTLFDDPQDYATIDFGIRMYNTYGRSLSYSQFQDYLATYSNELTPAPSISEQGFTNPNWPYRVGYFNGPDDQENERLVRALLVNWRW
jgi:RHS repeat-associated protein